jgi:hypothetical protein
LGVRIACEARTVGVERKVDERFSSRAQGEQRIQMLLGVFVATGVVPLVFKPASSVGDLRPHHRDDLDHEVRCSRTQRRYRLCGAYATACSFARLGLSRDCFVHVWVESVHRR